jgi:hypothetical protein
MRTAIHFVLATTLLLCGGLARAEAVTEAEAKAFVAALDTAIAARDVAGVDRLLSDNARFEATIAAGGQAQQVDMFKPQYMLNLRHVWTQASDYRSQRSNLRIELQGEKALVSSDISESVVLQGQSFSSRSRETTTLEKVQGKVLATHVRANMSR